MNYSFGSLASWLALALVFLWWMYRTFPGRTSSSVASCRLGEPLAEGGRTGLELRSLADGHTRYVVVDRERVRRTQPEGNQEFFYFAFTDSVIRALDADSSVFVLLQYTLLIAETTTLSHGGGEHDLPSMPVVIVEFDSRRANADRAVVGASVLRGWHWLAVPLADALFSVGSATGFSVTREGASFRISAEIGGRKVPLYLREVIAVAGG